MASLQMTSPEMKPTGHTPAGDEVPRETAQPTNLVPPDGGLTAWLQCAGSFSLWFVAWGLVNSFGVYQAYYEEVLLRHTSSSTISWIGSLQLAIFIAGTIIMGPIYDIGYLRAMLLTGSVLVTFGLMMTSISDQYWHFILSQSVVTGLGMTCLFVPSVALVPAYFARRRALAMGIAASGSSVGAIIFTIIFEQLQPVAGFGWATRAIAFVCLAVLVLPVAVLRKHTTRNPKRALIDPLALREAPFLLMLLVMFLAFLGLYIPYFYIQVFAVQEHIMQQQQLYLHRYLIVFMNVGSFFGRLLPNVLADRIGCFNTIVPITFITSVIAFTWISVMSTGNLIAFCFFYGFFSGSFVALVPVVWAALCPNMKLLGTRTGMSTVAMAIGLLVGNPIAGALLDDTDSGVLRLQVFCGATIAAAGIFLTASRLAKTGLQWRIKA